MELASTDVTKKFSCVGWSPDVPTDGASLRGEKKRGKLKYRTKPIVKEAIQWTSKNVEEMKEFMPASLWSYNPLEVSGSLRIHTLEGVMTALPGDWIIRGLNGEFYPCKPDIFEKTYEAVHE
jgi:hypothetical protein